MVRSVLAPRLPEKPGIQKHPNQSALSRVRDGARMPCICFRKEGELTSTQSRLADLGTVRFPNGQPLTVRVGNALRDLRRASSFGGYLDHTSLSCANIAFAVARRLPAGSSILGFGCGPCDKTATLALLGYRCSAIDDLNDAWHLEPGNRGPIASFAAGMGIDFRLSAG